MIHILQDTESTAALLMYAEALAHRQTGIPCQVRMFEVHDVNHSVAFAIKSLVWQ